MYHRKQRQLLSPAGAFGQYGKRISETLFPFALCDNQLPLTLFIMGLYLATH
jgi:hypothetical protein